MCSFKVLKMSLFVKVLFFNFLIHTSCFVLIKIWFKRYLCSFESLMCFINVSYRLIYGDVTLGQNGLCTSLSIVLGYSMSVNSILSHLYASDIQSE